MSLEECHTEDDDGISKYLVIYYGGRFYREPELKYVGGRRIRALDNPDTMSFMELRGIVEKKLGCPSNAMVYWHDTERSFEDGLRLIVDDKGIRSFLDFWEKARTLTLYVEDNSLYPELGGNDVVQEVNAGEEVVEVEVVEDKGIEDASAGHVFGVNGFEQLLEDLGADLGFEELNGVGQGNDDLEDHQVSNRNFDEIAELIEENPTSVEEEDNELAPDKVYAVTVRCFDEGNNDPELVFVRDRVFKKKQKKDREKLEAAVVFNDDPLGEAAVNNNESASSLTESSDESIENSEDGYGSGFGSLVESDEDSEHEDGERRKSRWSEFRERSDVKCRFEEGMVFVDNIAFKVAIRQYSIESRKEVRFLKNEPKRCTVKCNASKKCPWRIHASTSEVARGFQVKSIKSKHKCGRSFKNKM
ncbi:Transposase, MuDR, plant, partial [Corchorus olitorius]